MRATEHGLGAYAKGVDHLARPGPWKVRAAIGAAARAPGILLDVVDIATAEDRKRAAFVKGAGLLGGAAGGAVGAGGGPVGVFVGGALGAEGAEWVAGKIYDHRDDIARSADDIGQGVGRAGLQMMDATFGRGMPAVLRRAAFP